MRTALLLAALAALASGCATMIRGSTAPVTVTADRDSAFVFVDGIAAGVAPAQLHLRRSQRHHVEVVRDSFRIARAEVSRSLNPTATAASVLIGGLGGLALDLGTGAVFDLDPARFHLPLIPDTTGVDASLVALQLRQGREAAATGFAEADPNRRRAPPWMTIQVASGIYVGDAPDHDDGTTGGVGAALLIGARGPSYSARLSATASAGWLFDNSDRWELAALVGVITEAADGRLRFGLAAGPGLTGGHESNVCFLCDTTSGDRDPLTTRVGFSLLGEATLFITPQFGLGVQVPANLRFGESLRGVMIGWRYEGI